MHLKTVLSAIRTGAALFVSVTLLIACEKSAEELYAELNEAIRKGDDRRVEALLNDGAPIHPKRAGDRTPLHHAAYYARASIVERLIRAGADVSARVEPLQETPLHTAASFGRRVNNTVAALLIKAGADRNARDKRGNTPLHTAAHNGDLGVARDLLAARADLDARNEAGETPLHKAATSADLTIIRLLVQAGADVHAKTRAGKGVIGCAKDSMFRDPHSRTLITQHIIPFLISVGAKPE